MSENDNVVNFPGMKSASIVEKQMEKGKKISQQAAFGTMMEMAGRFKQLDMTIQRIFQMFAEFEDALNGQRTNFVVFVKMLKDMGVYNDGNWENAWNEYVVKPQEEGLLKHIETLRKQGGEDAFYGDVLDLARQFAFEPEEHNGQVISAKDVRSFYIQGLVNPMSRAQVVEDLRKKIPTLPVYMPAPPVDVSAPVEEDRKMPDCKYCGLDSCNFCNPPASGTAE